MSFLQRRLFQAAQAVDLQQAQRSDIQLIVPGQAALHALAQPVHLHQFLGGVGVCSGCLGDMPLRKDARREDGELVGRKVLFQQIEQLLRALGQGLVVIQPLRVTAEAPPVVDGLAAGTAVPLMYQLHR